MANFALRSIGLRISAVLAIFLGTVYGAAGGGLETGNRDRGEMLAGRLCASCHAVGKKDSSPLRTAPPFRNLAKQWPVSHIAEALAEGISTGHPGMPVFELAPAEIEDLIVWLEEIQRPQE